MENENYQEFNQPDEFAPTESIIKNPAEQADPAIEETAPKPEPIPEPVFEPVFEPAPEPQPEPVFKPALDVEPAKEFVDPNAGIYQEPQNVDEAPRSSKAFTIMKKNGSSAAIVIGMVLFGLCVIYRIVFPFINLQDTWDTAYAFMQSNHLIEKIPFDLSALDLKTTGYWTILVSNTLAMVPQVLYAVGLCLFVFRVRRHEAPCDENIGMSPIKAGTIIYIVFTCIALAVVVGNAVSVAMQIISQNINIFAADNRRVLFLCLGLLAALIILIVFLVYFIKISNTCGRVQKVFETGEMPKRNIPLFMIVMNYVLLGLSIVSSFNLHQIVQYVMLVVYVAAILLITIPVQLTRVELIRARSSN
ncbi:MAG: hypothetical protein IJM90_07900 [Firmicutes bacterium]|nr:hypothetical protein [Bacillota bacterium]